MTLSQERLLGILKMFEVFEAGERRTMTYEHDARELTELIRRYPIKSVAGEGDTQERVLNLLLWIARTVIHDETVKDTLELHALALLDYAHDQMDRGINCEGLSIILVESLLAIGIKARVVYMFPFSPYDCDNHVVAEAYIPERGRWIMVDPTYNSYFLDAKGRILSVLELRQGFADRDLIHVNEDLFYNDRDIAVEELTEIYEEYMAKNLFYLRYYRHNGYYSKKDADYLYFYPKDYDIERGRTLNYQFKKEQFKDHPSILEWIERSMQEQNRVTIKPSSIALLLDKPLS